VGRLFTAYRVLAIIVGVLLAFCALVSLPLKYLATDGSSLQRFGEATDVMGVAHGWVFMIYVVVTFLMARRSGWSIPFTVLALAAGLIPLVIFWVERTVVRRMKAEHPELAEQA
jgi:integral membrane protein